MWSKILLGILLFYSLIFVTFIFIYFSACRREKRFKKYFGFIPGENKNAFQEKGRISEGIKNQAKKIKTMFQKAEEVQETGNFSSFFGIFSQVQEELSVYRQMLKLARQNKFVIKDNLLEFQKRFGKIQEEINFQYWQKELNFPRIGV